MKKILSYLVVGLFLMFLAAGCATEKEKTATKESTNQESQTGLPKQMVWSVYSVGSGTYNDMAAIADIFTSEYKSQIRLLPSDTAIGRMSPLQKKTADFALVGDENWFSFEGDLDFASKNWGPQDVRLVWGPITPIGLAVRDNSDIKSIEDLKNKKIPLIISNPSVSNKMEAYLAYGGLTLDDVEGVEVSYSEQGNAFKAGQIDAIISNPYSAQMFELESAVKFKWISLNDPSSEKIDRVSKTAPTVQIGTFTDAAGMKKGEEVSAITYSVPIISYAGKDENEVYTFVAAINEQYEKYKNTTISLENWNLESVLKTPLVVPFHDGTVKYFKENNVWTEEAEKRNNELIERQKQLQDGWKTFVKTVEKDTEIGEKWSDWKARNIQ